MLNTKDVNKLGLTMIKGFIEANGSSDRKLIVLAIDKLIRSRTGFIQVNLSGNRIYRISKDSNIMRLNRKDTNINFVVDVRIVKSITTQLKKLDKVCNDISNMNNVQQLIESLAETCKYISLEVMY